MLIFRQLVLPGASNFCVLDKAPGGCRPLAGEHCNSVFVRENEVLGHAPSGWAPCRAPGRAQLSVVVRSGWVIPLCLALLDVFCHTSTCFMYRRQRPSREVFGFPVLNGGLESLLIALLWKLGLVTHLQHCHKWDLVISERKSAEKMKTSINFHCNTISVRRVSILHLFAGTWPALPSAAHSGQSCVLLKNLQPKFQPSLAETFPFLKDILRISQKLLKSFQTIL